MNQCPVAVWQHFNFELKSQGCYSLNTLCLTQNPLVCLWVFLIFKNVLFILGAALVLSCCTGFSLVAASRGYSLVAVLGLLIAVASPIAEDGL